MATTAQIAANRANAQHSTGPCSVEGKARSSRNNLRHGFRSQSVLLPGDDPAEYEELLAELTGHFDPEDLTEERFVREMADAEWRLRRVRAHQECVLTDKINELALPLSRRYRVGLPGPLHPDASPLHRDTCFAQFLRYESKFERQYERAYHGWAHTQDRLCRHDAHRLDMQLKSMLVPPVLPNKPKSCPAPAPTPAAVLPDEPNSTPRNAACPCGSGLKFKRCCGKNAPAVLTRRASAA